MIRLATADDAQALLAIYAAYIDHTAITFEYEAPPREEFAGRIRTILAQLPWLVHEQNGRVTGYAYASKHRDRVAYQWSVETSVYIHPDCHRQGIARTLYEALFDLLRRQGYYNAYAGITLPNPKSEQFHRSMGFAPVGVYEKVGYKLGQWHDVGWYHLTLQPHAAKPAALRPVGEVWEDMATGDGRKGDRKRDR
jgi:phosphinothricin acetyltransferase